jgi:polyisoprenoid-binding protein YceI
MTLRHLAATASAAALVLGFTLVPSASAQDTAAPLTFKTAKVTIDGTSNVHDWSASTTAVRVTRATLAAGVGGPSFWDAVVKPGAVEAFEVTIPATKLTSPRSGLDKNMYKALKTDQHPDIVFRLKGLTAKAGTPGAFTAAGTLRVAGVEKDVNLDVTLGRSSQGLVVKGTTKVLMTDFSIEPPTALFGTVRSAPDVTISFQTVLISPLS